MASWVESAAERFWQAAGGEPPFPRDLEASIGIALPVMIVRLPRLGIFSAEQWLARSGAQARLRGSNGAASHDRPLRACLIARFGNGCLLIDAADPPDEQRYSLAHETAHFILDYQLPYERATRRVGPWATDILDGNRRPDDDERIDAALAGVELRPFVQLLERGARGVERTAIAAAEARADLLALELLAPRECAVGVLPTGGLHEERVERGAERFAAGFGLPLPVGRAYARRLIDRRDGRLSWEEWLR